MDGKVWMDLKGGTFGGQDMVQTSVREDVSGRWEGKVLGCCERELLDG